MIFPSIHHLSPQQGSIQNGLDLLRFGLRPPEARQICDGQHRLGPAGGDKAGRDHLLLEVALQQADAQGEGHLKRQVACERSQQKPIIIVTYIYIYIHTFLDVWWCMYLLYYCNYVIILIISSSSSSSMEASMSQARCNKFKCLAGQLNCHLMKNYRQEMWNIVKPCLIWKQLVLQKVGWHASVSGTNDRRHLSRVGGVS